MRTRRLITPSGILGALALTLSLSGPAWAIWEGITPIEPVMPRWTWEDVDLQERLQDLRPEERLRLKNMPAEQRRQALEDMESRHGHGRGMGTEPGQMRRQMDQMPLDEMQRRTDTETTPSDDNRAPGTRQPGTERQTPDVDNEKQPNDENEMRRTPADEPNRNDDTIRQPPPTKRRPTRPGRTSRSMIRAIPSNSRG